MSGKPRRSGNNDKPAIGTWTGKSERGHDVLRPEHLFPGRRVTGSGQRQWREKRTNHRHHLTRLHGPTASLRGKERGNLTDLPGGQVLRVLVHDVVGARVD